MTGPSTCAREPGTLDLADYDYALPPERIAQRPLPERDASRLMVLARGDVRAPARHLHVRDLPSLLAPGDLLVVNATRVLASRLVGSRDTGGAAEALVLGPDGEPDSGCFRALVRISGRLRPGIVLRFTADPNGAHPSAVREARIRAVREDGEVVLSFAPGESPYSVGYAPLPPYIRRRPTPGRDPAPGPDDARADERAEDLARYQTVFARVPGAIAAPTAGLHLTEPLLAALADAGVRRAEVVLHVGAGTFRPLREADLRAKKLHAETFALPDATADAIDETRARGGRVVAVGTTSLRLLESAADEAGQVQPFSGETRLFITPGYRFRAVDLLLTNFHLPRSTLYMLVCAFAGSAHMRAAYAHAIAQRYRFYSYGDAMLLKCAEGRAQ